MRMVHTSKWQQASDWVEGDDGDDDEVCDENDDDDNVNDNDDFDSETPAEWDL